MERIFDMDGAINQVVSKWNPTAGPKRPREDLDSIRRREQLLYARLNRALFVLLHKSI